MSERLVISRPHYFTEPKSHCGYCSGKKIRDEDYYSLDSWSKYHANPNERPSVENCTLGFQTELISVELYDKLCNMGYRRSGKFMYKADMLRNCCRLYTIRTTPDDVVMSKDFKSTLKKFKKQVLPSKESVCKTSRKRFDYISEIVEAESVSTDFETRFEPAIYTKEKYRLFAKYQEHVHNDFKHSAKSFERFLCASPFSRERVLGTDEEWEQLNNWKKMTNSDKLLRLGPAHECYYHKKKLVAMAVTDFLPSGISSVYFIWDPDYHKWSLGKVSALRELCITKKINRNYYYMGYYIDDCPKMNYKARYGGELLDVCSHRYVSLGNLKNLVAPGKLFVMTESSDSNKSAGEDKSCPHGEFPINCKLDQLPDTFGQDGPLENIAEKIYGVDGESYANASVAARRLRSLGVPYAVDAGSSIYGPRSEIQGKDDIYNIPNVVPGLVPLEEILQMVLDDQLSTLQGKISLFDTNGGDIRLLSNFERESPQMRKIICDIVRLIGLENVQEALVIV